MYLRSPATYRSTTFLSEDTQRFMYTTYTNPEIQWTHKQKSDYGIVLFDSCAI